MRSYSARFDKLYLHVTKMLADLPDQLSYHNLAHTLDVLEQVQVIAEHEKLTDTDQLDLLSTAALLHDTGFLHVYREHEDRGCKMADTILPGFGYSKTEIAYINTLIMATRIPQTPLDKLGEMLCDADLDYLGRDDFQPISETLKQEWLAFGIIKSHDEWMQKQVGFFKLHHYFTSYSNKVRKPVKDKHFREILRQVENQALS